MGSVVRASIAGTATRRGYLGRNQTGANSRLGSAAKAGTAAAGAATLTLALKGTNIGTVAFAAGKAVATFTTTGGNPFLINAGDVLTLTAPATQDAALADLVGYVAVQ
ncbi:hypothetical protein [Methylobacterium aquaticum]|uniref:hypothetical protein n=1 Tax=Methylobacterium aquaticum TaxID=270351 RepID=UPI0019343339|nr:hypothetical protein [Methylobacterium aquaticum]QRE76796.1 hypothetical protein F1D61_27490 [Methylobacterium aquaticum]